VLLSDLIDRFPRLRFIYPHLGGSFGVMKQRILSRYYDVGMREMLERRLSRFWFDTAPPRWSRAEYRCAVETLGAERIVFGSDHPIAEDYLDRALKILSSDTFSEEERERIGRANAQEIFSL
jgi:predicted TIM-barrel fold metal-dependent hydrolase